MVNDNMSFSEALQMARELNAGTIKLIQKDSSGRPSAAFIVLNGRFECEQLLPVIERLEDKWLNVSGEPPNNSLHLTASRVRGAKKAKPRRARGK